MAAILVSGAEHNGVILELSCSPRTSPFYPMSTKENDRCLKEPLEQEHSWGEITNRGWKL